MSEKCGICGREYGHVGDCAWQAAVLADPTEDDAIARLTRERDEARAKVERYRVAVDDAVEYEHADDDERMDAIRDMASRCWAHLGES